MIYGISYLFMLCITLYFDFIKSNKSQSYHIMKYFTLLLLIVIAGLRYRIAPDTIAYQWYFNDFTPLLNNYFEYDFTSIVASYQYVWIFINSFFLTFFDYYTFQFFIAYISIYLLYKVARFFTNNTLFFLYLLFCTVYFYFSMEIIRQFLALVLLLNSLMYFSRRNYIVSFSLLLLALFTHRYAFLILPFYIMLLLPLNIKFKIYIFILSYSIIYLTYFFISQYFMGDIGYFESSLISFNGQIFNAGLSIILIVFMIFYKNYPNSFFNEHKNLLYSGLIAYLVIMLCKLTINPFFDRLLDYFIPFVLIFYSIVLPHFFKYRFRYPFILILVLITIPLIKVYLLYSPEPFTGINGYSRYYPYSSVIEKSIDLDREKIIRLEAKEPQ